MPKAIGCLTLIIFLTKSSEVAENCAEMTILIDEM